MLSYLRFDSETQLSLFALWYSVSRGVMVNACVLASIVYSSCQSCTHIVCMVIGIQ